MNFDWTGSLVTVTLLSMVASSMLNLLAAFRFKSLKALTLKWWIASVIWSSSIAMLLLPMWTLLLGRKTVVIFLQ